MNNLTEILAGVELTEEQTASIAKYTASVVPLSELDKRVSTGVETYKNGKGKEYFENQMVEREKAIRSEYAEPTKSPEMLEIEKLKNQIAEASKVNELSKKKATLTARAATLNMPTDIVESIYALDNADEVLDSLYTVVSGKEIEVRETVVKDVIGNQSTPVKAEGGVDYSKMTSEERFAAYQKGEYKPESMV